MELYAKVRRYVVVDHHRQREAARYFGISRDMVTKMVANAQLPGYRHSAPVVRLKLEPFLARIIETPEADKKQHRRQRQTAKRIFERLRDEHGYTGKYTVVKDVVREYTLVHPPGHAQVDFGEAVVVVGGIQQKGRFSARDWPWICRTAMRRS